MCIIQIYQMKNPRKKVFPFVLTLCYINTTTNERDELH